MVAVAVAAILRLRLLDLPLERDEGEYAYMAQLLLQGVPPYAEAYALKMPGVFGVYALLISIFGHSQAAIHLGLTIANAATIILVFWVGRRVFDARAGWVAAVSYAALSLAPSLTGLAANAEHFVVLPMLAGLLAILRAFETRRYVDFAIGGGLLGVAFLMKQHAAFFAVFIAATLVWREFRHEGATGDRPGPSRIACLATFLGGLLLPLLAVAVWMLAVGNFSAFWFWTVTYPLIYAGQTPVQQAITNLSGSLPWVFGPTWSYWVLAGGGLLALFGEPQPRGRRAFLVGWLGASVLTVVPGLHFRPHYFLLTFPVVSVLGGIAVSAAVARWGRNPPARALVQTALVALPLLNLVYSERAALFGSDLLTVSYEIYGLSPFSESLEIARYIEERSDDSDSIFVFGSEPQIYFYSGRRSATSHILTYELVRPHAYATTMQQEMIQQVEARKPKFIVSVSVYTSWLTQAGADLRIFDWFQSDLGDQYDRVGLIDILGPQDTRYYWDRDQADRTPQSNFWLAVYKRSSAETNGDGGE